MRLPIHAALVIFCPDSDPADTYLLDLARTRLRLFASQKSVDSCTVITVVHQLDEVTRSILESLKGRGGVLKGLDRVDVVVLKGLKSPNGGLTQVLAETEAEWTYYSDDGHILPLRQDSVFRFVEEAVRQYPDCDVVVESDLYALPAEEFNRHRHAKQYGLRWRDFWYKNEEYGLAMKTELADLGYYAPTGSCRNVHGMVFSALGLKVASNPRHGELFLHHGLYVGPNAIKFKKAEMLLPKLYPQSEVVNGLREKLEREMLLLREQAIIEDKWSV